MPLPPFVAKYFWGDDLTELDFNRHQNYIIQTILEKGDRESIVWLFQQTSKDKLKQLLPHLKLTGKSANYWRLYLN